MVYLVIAILILIGIYRYDYKGLKQGRTFYLVIVCILLISIAGLRYRLGQDTLGYLSDYDELKPISDLKITDFSKTRFAPGFVIITSIFKQFTEDFSYFQFFHAAIVNIVLVSFFYKYTKHVFFALLIYFVYEYFLLSFQQMREALAVCVFLLAWPFFRDGKWIFWYLASLLAFSFHMSAFMMFLLPLICLPGVKQLFIFGQRTWIFCLILAVVAIAIQAVFFKYIELLALTESMMERAQAYDKSTAGKSGLNITGIISVLFKFIIYPFLALYFLNKNKDIKTQNRFNKLNAFVLMSIYISVIGIFIAIIFRYNNYFFPFSTLIISDMVFSYIPRQDGKKVRLRLAYWVILMLPMFAFFINGYTYGLNKSKTMKTYMVYYPYRSIIDKTENQDTEKTLRYMRRHY